jgi:hypothetical protein
MMKRFVRAFPWQGLLIGLGALLLVRIIEQETVTSYVVVFGLAATMLWQEWGRHRREKGRAVTQKPFKALLGAGRNKDSR